MEPAAKKVFGFPRNFDLKSQKSGLARIGFLIHSKRMIEMLDVALGMIGPEHEILTEILTKLGKRHVHHGVKKEFFPILGEALKDALSERLDGKWTYEVEEAWEIVYGEMSRDIIKGMS